MRRAGGLFETLVSFENLLAASRRARRGKRQRPDVADFEFNLETELFTLQRQLEDGTWRPGPFRTFRICEPKERLISAAPYRDRVVHHALLAVVEPVFERSFVHDSYACRAGKGTHRALALFGLIIDGSNAQEEVIAYFPGDDLFTPLERRRGIPIGNLTSQFFANVYLDPLDHHVLEHLKVPGYVRYADDLVVFSSDPASLHAVRREMDEFLARRLRLELHETKTQLFPVTQGTDFLGFRVFPRYRLLRRTTLARRRRLLAALAHRHARGEVDLDQVRASIQSWLGHARHASSFGIRRTVLGSLVFSGSSPVPGRPPAAGRGRGRFKRPCGAGRRVEQQPEQPALRQPQLQPANEPQQRRGYSRGELSSSPACRGASTDSPPVPRRDQADLQRVR